MAKMRLIFVLLLVVLKEISCTISSLTPEMVPELVDGYMKFSNERAQLHLAAQEAKRHPFKFQRREVEDSQGGGPDVQFTDEEDNFETFPMNNEGPRGFELPPFEVFPQMEMGSPSELQVRPELQTPPEMLAGPERRAPPPEMQVPRLMEKNPVDVAKMHPFKFERSEAEDSQGGGPDVQFLDEEDNFETFPMNNEGPRGFELPPFEVFPQMEMGSPSELQVRPEVQTPPEMLAGPERRAPSPEMQVPPQQMGPPVWQSPNPADFRLMEESPVDVASNQQAEQQEFLNNFWANQNANPEEEQHFVMSPNLERQTGPPEQPRAADPHLHHHHKGIHSKGFTTGFQQTTVIQPAVVVTPGFSTHGAINQGYSSHGGINQGLSSHTVINQGHSSQGLISGGGHGIIDQGYAGHGGINQGLSGHTVFNQGHGSHGVISGGHGGHTIINGGQGGYAGGGGFQGGFGHGGGFSSGGSSSSSSSTNVHISNVNSNTQHSSHGGVGFLKSTQDQDVNGQNKDHVVAMRSPDLVGDSPKFVEKLEPDHLMNIEQPNHVNVAQPIGQKPSKEHVGSGLLLQPGLLPLSLATASLIHKPLVPGVPLVPTVPLLPTARASSVVDQSIRNIQNIQNMQKTAQFYNKLNENQANLARSNEKLLENAKKQSELIAKQLQKGIEPKSAQKPLLPESKSLFPTQATPQPLFPEAKSLFTTQPTQTTPQPLFPPNNFFQKQPEARVVDNSPSSIFARLSGRASEAQSQPAKPPRLFDLSNFGKNHMRRQADFAKSVDGKIPVAIQQEPVKIVQEKEVLDNVGTPYLFEVPKNRNSDLRQARSNPDFLNVAKGITEGALSSIVNAGKLLPSHMQSDVHNLNLASDIMHNAFGTARAASDYDEIPDDENPLHINKDLSPKHNDDFKDLMSELQHDKDDKSLLLHHKGLNLNKGLLTPHQNEGFNSQNEDDDLKQYLSEMQAGTADLTDQDLIDLGDLNEESLSNMKREVNSTNEKNSTKTELLNEKEVKEDPECLKDCDKVLGSILGAQQKPQDEKSLEKDKATTDKHLKTIIENQKDFHKGKMNQENIDKLYKKQGKVIEELKNSQNDADLIMIGNIGESLMEDMFKDKEEENMKITKRSIRTSSQKNMIPVYKHHLVKRIRREEPTPFEGLLTDPKTNIDIPKTLDHIGSVARHLFEDESAPIFHVRNLVGSAQNSAMSAMKIPPKQLFIPTTYSIVNDNELRGDGSIVGEESPVMFNRMGGVESQGLNREENKNGKDLGKMFSGFTNAFDRVGSAIKQGIANGRQTIIHVSEAANNAKSAIHTMQNLKPKLVKTEQLDNNRQRTIMISPRILDINQKDEQVGATSPKNQDTSSDLLKFGDVFDAVGISKPNEELELEKIVFTSHQAPVVYRKTPSKVKASPTAIRNILKMQNKDLNKMEKTIQNLDETEKVVGASNLKEFMVQMKSHMDTMHSIADEHEEKLIEQKQTRLQNKKSRKGKKYISNDVLQKKHHKQQKGGQHNSEEPNQQKQNTGIPEEDLRVGLDLPPELLHPYMGLPEFSSYLQEGEERSAKEEKLELKHRSAEQHLPTENKTLELKHEKAKKQHEHNRSSENFENDQPIDDQENVELKHKKSKKHHGGNNYYRSSGNDIQDEHTKFKSTSPALKKYLKNEKLSNEQKAVLQATNALDFEQMFNEAKNQEEKQIDKRQPPSHNPEERTNMKINKMMKTPFMGRPNDEHMHKYYSQYNDMDKIYNKNYDVPPEYKKHEGGHGYQENSHENNQYEPQEEGNGGSNVEYFK